MLGPFREWYGHVPCDPLRIGLQDLTVLHLYMNRRPTVQTWGIDADCFIREKPANCQRFEASLSEPLLSATDCDLVLGGKIAEWSETPDIVRFGEKPYAENP